MGYMQGITKRGIDFVSRITGLLNQLTEEDFEDTHVWLRVTILDESSDDELGFWSNEYGCGNWAYFDGARREVEARKNVSVTDIESAIWAEASNLEDGHLSRKGAYQLALAVTSVLKKKRVM